MPSNGRVGERRTQRLEVRDGDQRDAKPKRGAGADAGPQRRQSEPGERGHSEQEQIAEASRRAQALHRRKDVVHPAVDRRPRAERQHEPHDRDRDQHQHPRSPGALTARIASHTQNAARPMTTNPGKKRVHRILEERAAPGCVVNPAGGGEITLERRRVVGDVLERSHHALLARHAAIGEIDRQHRNSRRRRSRAPASTARRARAATSQESARSRATATITHAEDDQIARRVGHQRHPQRQQQRIAERAWRRCDRWREARAAAPRRASPARARRRISVWVLKANIDPVSSPAATVRRPAPGPERCPPTPSARSPRSTPR